MEHPNILILGLKHVNSSIVVRMLLELGWKQNDLDEHGESVEVRTLNEMIRRRQDYQKRMQQALAAMEEPWVLKDPGFRLTLTAWGRALKPYRSILVYLIKDHTLVANSHIRRFAAKDLPKIPVSLDSIESWQEQCRNIYNWWSGPKIQIDSEDICRAVERFDVMRAREGQPVPKEIMDRVFTGDPNSNYHEYKEEQVPDADSQETECCDATVEEVHEEDLSEK